MYALNQSSTIPTDFKGTSVKILEQLKLKSNTISLKFVDTTAEDFDSTVRDALAEMCKGKTAIGLNRKLFRYELSNKIDNCKYMYCFDTEPQPVPNIDANTYS